MTSGQASASAYEDHVVLRAGDKEFIAAEFYGFWLVLLLASWLLSYFVQRRGWQLLSEASVTLLVGFLGGAVLQFCAVADGADRLGEVEVRDELVGFSSSFVFCVLLPPIIFVSGFKMQGSFFWANVDKILALAFAGTLVSTLVVGGLLFSLRDVVALPDLCLAEAMAFAALISATDPVTTLATFEQLQVDPNLFNIVFGESALNDAVAIVLFHTFAKLVTYEGGLAPLLAFAFFDFLVIFVGSALVGFVMGIAAALLLKHVSLRAHTRAHGPQLELAVFLTYCYGPFLLAECLSLSGMVTMLFTGFAMKHYAYHNLSEHAKGLVESIIALLAHISETVLFLDVGTSAWRSFHTSTVLILVVMLACLVGRAAHVYPLMGILNARRIEYPRRKFETAHAHIVWFAGLRGAVSYALSYSFPGRYRKEVISTTMAVVLLSVWVLGGFTIPFLRYIGIRQLQPAAGALGPPAPATSAAAGARRRRRKLGWPRDGRRRLGCPANVESLAGQS